MVEEGLKRRQSKWTNINCLLDAGFVNQNVLRTKLGKIIVLPPTHRDYAHV